MIPKIIHFCWFGNAKSEEVLRCIESWKKMCPDFEIKEWGEENFDYNSHPFTKKMYQEKKWAFVADYVRLEVLQDEGGFYLDTDMLLVKSLSPFTHYECVLGEEAKGVISAGMIGAMPHHPYIERCREYYDLHQNEIITIPRALTKVFDAYENKSSLHILPPFAFYPFDADHIHKYHGQDLGNDTYGVHLWHYSWGHPLNRFFKKIGVYRLGKKVTELLGIKKLLKKLFGFV